jgi:hypothetical protein
MNPQYDVKYPESLSRGLLILRMLFGAFYVGIPHGFLLLFRMIATQFIAFLAFWAVLFTGRYPENWYQFVVGTNRWQNNVNAYMGFMTDDYPPFSGKLENTQDYAAQTTIEYPQELSRGLLILRILFGVFYVMIPHGFILMFRGIATVFLGFLAFWAVLFTGRYPENWFQFNVGTTRWGWRVNAYMSYLTDQYPPFTGKANPEQ